MNLPLFLNSSFLIAELQNRMTSQMNDGLANWERDRRVACPDYEEKQLLALNGKFRHASSVLAYCKPLVCRIPTVK